MNFLFLIILFQNEIPYFDKPTLIVSPETEAQIFIKDVAFDDANHLYALDRDDQNIYKLDIEGKVIKHFGGKGQGPGEFMSTQEILFHNQMIWVTDTEAGGVHLFKNDRFLKEVKTSSFPYTITTIGNNVYVSPMSLHGAFTLLNENGDILKTFRFDPAKVSTPNKKMASLWGMFHTTPFKDHLFLGFTFLPLAMTVTLDGNINKNWDLSEYLFTHSIMTIRGEIPESFSATAYTTGPNGNIWVAGCQEEGKLCNILYIINPETKKVLQRKELKIDIRRFRYFKTKKQLFIVDRDGVASFYQLKQSKD